MARQGKKYTYLLLEKVSAGYLMVMLLGFPLFYHNNYIDIVQAKKNFFLTATMVYAAACLILVFLGRKKIQVWERHVPEKQEGKERIHAWIESLRLDSTDLFAGIFAAGLLVSTVFAQDRADAWRGLHGRQMGAAVMLACIMAYALLSRYTRITQAELWAYLLGSSAVYVLGICNTFQVDLLQMKENLAPEEHYFFIGTMGNLNVSAGFMAIMVPAGMALFYYARERFSKVVYSGYLFLGFTAMLCCRCDTAVVCAAAAFLAVYWPAFVSEGGMKKAQQMFGLWIAASAAVAFLRVAFAGRVYAFDGIGLFTVSWEMIAGELLLWGALQLYTRCAWKVGEPNRMCVRRILYGTLAALAAAVIAVVLVKSAGGARTDNSIWGNLKITDESGNNRGYI